MYKLDCLNDLVDNENPIGLWIHGPAGSGKSYSVRKIFKPIFIKPQNKWWDGYEGEPYILLDDFDRQGACLAHYLKIWAD